MKFLCSLLVLAITISASFGQEYPPLDHSVVLDQFGLYVLQWTYGEKMITFEVQVLTLILSRHLEEPSFIRNLMFFPNNQYN